MGWDKSPAYRAWVPAPPLHSEKPDWSWWRSGTARGLLWCPEGMERFLHLHLSVPSSGPTPTPCPAFPPFPSQERSILLSIESLGQTLLGSVAGVPHNALEKAAWTVAVRTKAVMHRHCRTPSRVCVLNCPSTKDCNTSVPRLWTRVGSVDLTATCFPQG